MRNENPDAGLWTTIALIAIAWTMTLNASAQTETVLYNLWGQNGGAFPMSTLARDTAGNLYGTGFSGGLYGGGMVFELSPAGGGTWTHQVLYSFNPSNGSDGANPEAGVVLDAAGNLYGTTPFGDEGTVYKLSSKTGGGWAETVLHHFYVNPKGGYEPTSQMVLDAAGNIYGTASSGTAFELILNGNGTWGEKVLHTFMNNGRDGAGPYAGMIFDAAGNLYGTTCLGGPGNYGTVFELSPTASGTWSEKVIYSFKGNQSDYHDGWCPQASVVFDGDGNLYGTTTIGGTNGNYGVVFELSPKAGGGWAETILHNFDNNGVDGYTPLGSLMFDAAGNLYGTTHGGGAYTFGTVFELTPSSSGWAETILHSFDYTDGSYPEAALIMDGAGNLYGTASGGGVYGGGVVFEITP